MGNASIFAMELGGASDLVDFYYSCYRAMRGHRLCGSNLQGPTDHRSAWVQCVDAVLQSKGSIKTSNGTKCKIVEMKIRKNNERYHNNRMCGVCVCVCVCVFCFGWI